MMCPAFTDPPSEVDTDRYGLALFQFQNGPGFGSQEYCSPALVLARMPYTVRLCEPLNPSVPRFPLSKMGLIILQDGVL